jgi:N-acetylglucosamine-6-phosphate deacetylase
MLRLLLRTRPMHRLVAVSDAAPVAALPPGSYRVLHQTATLTPDGKLYNDAEHHLVGAAVGLRDCLGHLVDAGVCTPEDCRQLGGSNPLALLGLSRADLARDVPLASFDADRSGVVFSQPG